MIPPYRPTSISELAELLAAGVLVEGHTVDFKREVGSGKSANASIAKDLAAFAIDGGRLFIGVDEGDRSTHPSVAPVDLPGLRERFDQIARSAVHPPLRVECTELHLDDDPTRGCLIVTVPASPVAPHQAADRYWGRGDTTNHVLSPFEMDVLYERRTRQRASTAGLLDQEIARDPVPAELRAHGHVFVVAQPVNDDDELLYSALNGEPFNAWAHGTLIAKARSSRWQPDVISSKNLASRAGGNAIHTYEISPERQLRPNGDYPAKEQNLADLEIRDDGGVRYFCGRATDIRDGEPVLLDAVIAGSVVRTVEAARAVADASGFSGNWHVGVALTDVRGAVSVSVATNFMAEPTGYSANGYVRTGLFQYDDLVDPVDLMHRLLDPLLRSLRSPFDVGSLLRP